MWAGADTARRLPWALAAAGRGLSLLEVVLVLAVLGLAAGLCLPLIGGYLEEQKLAAAAQDAAQAIRFAQTATTRTRTVHGVAFSVAQNSRSVFYLDALVVPTVAVNPADKRPYLLLYDADPHLEGVSVVSSRFEYAGGERTDFVEFDARGVPRRSATLQPLESGEVVLEVAGRRRRLEVRPNGTVALP